MKNFKDFGIKTTIKSFVGDKIKITKILNRKIAVHDYKLEDSKIYKDRGTCKCLYLQISIDEIKYVVFTSAGKLIEAILQITKENFPFTTTIIEENERYQFT